MEFFLHTPNFLVIATQHIILSHYNGNNKKET